MVYKRTVLFRIQNFQQGRGRVTAHIHAHLVHLIQQEQWILYRDLGHVLQDFTWHGTYVGTPMPPYFRLITYATQRHAYKFTVSGTCNRLAQRSFSYTGWPDQTQNRRF